MTTNQNAAASSNLRREWPPLREFVIAAVLAAALLGAIQLQLLPGTLFEGIAGLTGFCFIWFALREHPFTWVVGTLNLLLFGWAFWQAGAYVNLALQGIGLATSLYGAFYWLFGSSSQGEPPITRTPAKEWIVIAAGIILISIVLLVLRGGEDVLLSVIDSVSGGIGIGASVLTARKRQEGWLASLVANALLMPLYWISGYMFFFWLSPLFLAGLYYGHVVWKKRQQQALSA
jgi:nicotinamide mononucleotide transporter